jgi:hypothetical protein
VKTKTQRAEEIANAVRHFVAHASAPALLESGEDPIPLVDPNYRIELQNGKLWIEGWTETANLGRRIVAVRETRRDRLILRAERFGRPATDLVLADLNAPRAQHVLLTSQRQRFREVFRKFLQRQFTGWRIAVLTTEADLEHSLSPSYSRALLVRGDSAWAAVGAAEDAQDPAGVLTTGLIWLDHLRRRERHLILRGIAVFVPEGFEKTTCLRVRWLDSEAAHYAVFVYRNQMEERLDLADAGNISTRLTPYRDPRAGCDPEWIRSLEAIARRHNAELIDAGEGHLSLRVRGLELARVSAGAFYFGLDRKQASLDAIRCLDELESLVAAVSERRRPGADKLNALYTRYPEAWLESQVRQHLHEIDATLESRPVYGQVTALAAVDRGLIDLLAIDCNGRLAVLELKASEDIHLPLQALDYWIRVRWHLERGEFRGAGYFPGRQILNAPPKLFLISPALQFHPTNEVVLRYFSHQIEVERVGVGLEWQQRLHAVARFPRCPSSSKSNWRSAT